MVKTLLLSVCCLGVSVKRAGLVRTVTSATTPAVPAPVTTRAPAPGLAAPPTPAPAETVSLLSHLMMLRLLSQSLVTQVILSVNRNALKFGIFLESY